MCSDFFQQHKICQADLPQSVYGIWPAQSSTFSWMSLGSEVNSLLIYQFNVLFGLVKTFSLLSALKIFDDRWIFLSYRLSGSLPWLSLHLRRRLRVWGNGRACSVGRAALHALTLTDRQRMDRVKDKQETILCQRQRCRGLAVNIKNSYIICSVQMDNYPLLGGAGRQCNRTNTWIWMHHSYITYQCAESLTVIDGAGKHHGGVPKVSL